MGVLQRRARWYLISGKCSRTGPGCQAAGVFANRSMDNLFHGAQFTSPATNAFYRLGGFARAGASRGDAAWSSGDGGRTWTDLSKQSRNPVSTRWSQAAGNALGHILLVGGVNDTTGVYSNDVWLSENNARTWQVVAKRPPFGVRLYSTVNSHQMANGGPSVFYQIGGQSRTENFNDVFVTSDQGRTWHAITARAPWEERCYHSTLITKDGLMLVVAGKGDMGEPGFGNEVPLNDVQLSADGGYSWSTCVIDAEWQDRGYQSAVLDAEGRLVVMAGLIYPPTGGWLAVNGQFRPGIRDSPPPFCVRP